MRCASHWSPSVRMSAMRRSPRRPSSVTMTSSSRHFWVVYVPESQICTRPAPYSPRGISPSKLAYSSGWSSVRTARWLRPGSVGSPLGSAQLTSTPSRSSRKSKCLRRASCSWITKVRPPGRGTGAASGTGSLVRSGSRIDRYRASRSDPGTASEPSGSPRSANSSSTSPISSWASPGSPISSHVRGAATHGRSRPRSEYGATVVLAAEFCDQSTSTLPSRKDLRCSETTSLGWSASSARASSFATAETCSLVAEPSRPAYRWMPFEPLVTGTLGRPIPSSSSRARCATSTHSSRPAPGPGSRSTTSRSGGPGAPSGPKRHCGTCSSSAAICANHTSVAGSVTSGYSVTRLEWRTRARASQSGAPGSSCLAKNASPAVPSTQRLRVTGRPRT